MAERQTNPLPNLQTLPALQLGWFELMEKNKPQSNAAAGGILLLMVSGYHIGWSLWRSIFPGYWSQHISDSTFILILSSWFLAATLGSTIGALLISNWRRKTIYYICCCLSATSSIFFIAGFEYYQTILVGRILAGLAHGIVYVTTITHLAENLDKDVRGRALAVINYMIITTIFVTTILFGSDSTMNKADMYFGIATLGHSVLALLFIPCLTYESVPFLLRKGLEREALTTMMKLRRETFETWTIRNDLQELKLMVSEDIENDSNIISNGNIRPIMLITANRVLAFLSSNMILNTILIGLTQTAFAGHDIEWHVGGVILALARYVFAIISLFCLDFFTRKQLISITGAMMVIVILIYTVLSIGFRLEEEATWLPALFFCSFQVILSLGIDPVHHVLTAEAFNSAPKAYWSIVFVTAVEHTLQVVAIVVFKLYTVNVHTVLFTTAFLALMILLLLELYMPETRGLSVRQARLKYRGQRSLLIPH